MARYETAATIVNDVAVECGLASSADVYASTDPNFVLLRTLLKRAGRELSLARSWSQLHREATITVQALDTGVYDLPADFVAMIDGSGYDRGTDWALDGPISPEQWQYLQTTDVTPIRVGFRIAQNQIWFNPSTLAENKVIAFEYRTRLWAMPSGETAPTLDAPTANTDTVLFNPELISRLVKLYWCQARGFDTTAAIADYNRVFAYTAATEPAAVLSLNGCEPSERLVDGANYPESGWAA